MQLRGPLGKNFLKALRGTPGSGKRGTFSNFFHFTVTQVRGNFPSVPGFPGFRPVHPSLLSRTIFAHSAISFSYARTLAARRFFKARPNCLRRAWKADLFTHKSEKVNKMGRN